MTEPIVAWPLTHDQRELVVFLGQLIRKHGAARFTSGHVVCANHRDFPGEWEPTLFAIHALLYRLFWHAYLDPEVVVEDVRPYEAPVDRMLTTSLVELGEVTERRIEFHVAAIGNDDVAGLLAHQIGAAFLALAPPDPFREAKREATPAEESVAAVYLGLGVLVANSSMYRRHASRMVAREVITEQFIAKVGGLSIVDATLLLAVQDLVREEYQSAFVTLHKPQHEWVGRWMEELEPHEAELRALLELDSIARPGEPGRAAERSGAESIEPAPLVRRDEPRQPQEVVEPDRRKFNSGQTTFRVPQRKQGRALLGLALGSVGLLLPLGVVVGPVLMLAGGLAGRYLAGRVFECADPDCRAQMKTEVPICPRCGGTIADTIPHAKLRLDRLDELERAHSSSKLRTVPE